MEIDQFIESDMRAFLDKRQAGGAQTNAAITSRKDGVLAPDEMAIYMPERDFVSDLEKAIGERDMEKAKRVLQDLKAYAGKYPVGAPERGEGERLFKSLYQRFQKEMVKDHELQEDLLEEELHDFSPPPLPPSSPFSFSSPSLFSPSSSLKPEPLLPRDELVAQSKPRVKPRDLATLAEEKQKRKALGIDGEKYRSLSAEIKEIERLADENAYTAAIKAYHDLKERLVLDHLSPDQRTHIIPRLTRIYQRIHGRLIKRVGTNEGSKGRNDALIRYKEHLGVVERAIAAGELAEAMLQYQTLVAIHHDLPADISLSAKSRLKEIHGAIMRLRDRIKGKEHPLEREERSLLARP